MKRSNGITILSCLAALALCLASLPVAAARDSGPRRGARAQAQGAKLSEDLRDRVGKRGRVGVIVQLADGARNVDGGDGGAVEAFEKRGGKVKQRFRNVGAFAADVEGEELEGLSAREDVLYISPDRPIYQTGHLETTTGAGAARAYGASPASPLTGRGVAIAFLDSGVDAHHRAFLEASTRPGRQRSRVVAQADFASQETSLPKDRYDDFYGHGTHVAAVAAGGAHVADGGYTGVAPEADIVSVKVLGRDGRGLTSDAVAALDWVISNRARYNVRVLNLSFGSAAVDSYTLDPLCRAVERAWRAGLVVVAAAGNEGKDKDGRKVYGAIHSPGISPYAITVGAANTFDTDWRGDDGVASFSSRGPTRGYRTDASGIRRYDNLIKPDLVAPGNKVLAAASSGSKLTKENPELVTYLAGPPGKGEQGVLQLSGTSVAAPAVAGAAALLFQRNPQLSPNLVKALLEYTAQPLPNFNTLEQGAGLLNVEGAARLAALVRTDLETTPAGAPLLNGPSPLPQSTVAGTTFDWSGGLVQRWNVVGGAELVTTMQGVYAGGGVSLAEGVTISEGVTLSENTFRVDGALLSRGVVMSDGVLLSDGRAFPSGSLVLSGVIMGDGVILADRQLFSDGVILSDSTPDALGR